MSSHKTVMRELKGLLIMYQISAAKYTPLVLKIDALRAQGSTASRRPRWFQRTCLAAADLLFDYGRMLWLR